MTGPSSRSDGRRRASYAWIADETSLRLRAGGRREVGISLDRAHAAGVADSDCGEDSGTTGSYVSWIPRIGAEFAGYRLDALLGHGGMSIVYRAQHIVLERKVALKLLSPQLSEDESFRERFMRESRLAARLDHPNIIPIYEASESDDVFFIAMRYVEGADLRKLLKDGPSIRGD